MPTAKRRSDSGGEWKNRHFNEVEREALNERLCKKLRGFYPDMTAVADPAFDHPADSWINTLISEAESAISMMLWLRKGLANEELKAERKDLLNTLNKADNCLSKLSHDLDIMFGVDADVLDCRDKIRELVPYIEAAETAINRLQRAKKLADARHDAAVEMAIRVGRILNRSGITMPATGDTNFEYTPETIQILKTIGDEFGLVLEPLTWRDTIIEAKKSAPDIK